MGARVLLGTQSWNFRGWVGPFYPVGIKPAAMLSFYAKVFDTIEVDSTFYGVPPVPVFEDWAASVPANFRFALKVPQQITHEKRLVGGEQLFDTFLQRALTLEDRLGPLLLQLSSNFYPTGENKAALRGLLRRLPEPFRCAVEFRHGGWVDPSVIEILQRRNAAFVLADGRWIRRRHLLELAKTPTADFAYIRWMGASRTLTDFSAPQIDRDEDLERWAVTLKSLAERVDNIYGYFNNHYQGHSPHSARMLQRLVGQRAVDPTTLHPQADLFSNQVSSHGAT